MKGEFKTRRWFYKVPKFYDNILLDKYFNTQYKTLETIFKNTINANDVFRKSCSSNYLVFNLFTLPQY